MGIVSATCLGLLMKKAVLREGRWQVSKQQAKAATIPPGSIVFVLFETARTTHDRMWYVTEGATTRAVYDWVQAQRAEVETQAGGSAIVKVFTIHNG
jgi:hypothetical protein